MSMQAVKKWIQQLQRITQRLEFNLEDLPNAVASGDEALTRRLIAERGELSHALTTLPTPPPELALAADDLRRVGRFLKAYVLLEKVRLGEHDEADTDELVTLTDEVLSAGMSVAIASTRAAMLELRNR